MTGQLATQSTDRPLALSGVIFVGVLMALVYGMAAIWWVRGIEP